MLISWSVRWFLKVVMMKGGKNNFLPIKRKNRKTSTYFITNILFILFFNRVGSWIIFTFNFIYTKTRTEVNTSKLLWNYSLPKCTSTLTSQLYWYHYFRFCFLRVYWHHFSQLSLCRQHFYLSDLFWELDSCDQFQNVCSKFAARKEIVNKFLRNRNIEILEWTETRNQ